MKTIGLIGGMSWESSKVYYELMNQKVKQDLGGFHSCKSILYSVDFHETQYHQHRDEWSILDGMMADAAQRVEKAGAEIIVLCTNTMHLCANAITSAVSIPFLHIGDAVGKAIQKQELKKVALLGTKFTMEKDFYKGRLLDHFGIEVIVPQEKEREIVHQVIFQELVKGEISDGSREVFKRIIEGVEAQGAEGVILGCTEIPLLISETDVNIPVFDTTKIHAFAAVELAIKNG